MCVCVAFVSDERGRRRRPWPSAARCSRLPRRGAARPRPARAAARRAALGWHGLVQVHHAARPAASRRTPSSRRPCATTSRAGQHAAAATWEPCSRRLRASGAAGAAAPHALQPLRARCPRRVRHRGRLARTCWCCSTAADARPAQGAMPAVAHDGRRLSATEILGRSSASRGADASRGSMPWCGRTPGCEAPRRAAAAREVGFACAAVRAKRERAAWSQREVWSNSGVLREPPHLTSRLVGQDPRGHATETRFEELVGGATILHGQTSSEPTQVVRPKRSFCIRAPQIEPHLELAASRRTTADGSMPSAWTRRRHAFVTADLGPLPGGRVPGATTKSVHGWSSSTTKWAPSRDGRVPQSEGGARGSGLLRGRT